MAGLAGVLWVNKKQLSKQLYDCVACGGGRRRVTDNEELRVLYD